MTKPKHAFLIMAHSNPRQLSKLLTLLDHERVDVYLHVDKKAAFSGDAFSSCLNRSGIFLVPRRGVNWGGRSQIECELSLIQAALPGEYAYYHLLSGVDLPLKTMDQILSFFDRNPNKEFVSFDSPEPADPFRERFSLYWPFQESERRSGISFRLQKYFSAIQRKLGVDRCKKDSFSFHKGANWFSCTHAFLSLLISEKRAILKRYANTRCCDEVFLQTFLMQTSFRDAVFDLSHPHRSNMRAIDWERGFPYTYRREDVAELLSSEFLFARKFDENVDADAVNAIVSALQGSSLRDPEL